MEESLGSVIRHRHTKSETCVRGTSQADGETREDGVALPVPERLVHRRREEREAEAGEGAETRHGCECCQTGCNVKINICNYLLGMRGETYQMRRVA